ncbi:hypothetical protein BDU57DRAFT_261886 [Ampelomyces quisqualis]|uniref:Uncharacterized protein n=1 Tax=Ampelomyces quisqualis TaxID=50730 RepID=A0A6A5QJR7_AMPQU|nr:hypothetical protein BDU57DRAFT_261886 [Ampelomyces quisqualis]
MRWPAFSDIPANGRAPSPPIRVHWAAFVDQRTDHGSMARRRRAESHPARTHRVPRCGHDLWPRTTVEHESLAASCRTCWRPRAVEQLTLHIRRAAMRWQPAVARLRPHQQQRGTVLQRWQASTNGDGAAWVSSRAGSASVCTGNGRKRLHASGCGLAETTSTSDTTVCCTLTQELHRHVHGPGGRCTRRMGECCRRRRSPATSLFCAPHRAGVVEHPSSRTSTGRWPLEVDDCALTSPLLSLHRLLDVASQLSQNLARRSAAVAMPCPRLHNTVSQPHDTRSARRLIH